MVLEFRCSPRVSGGLSCADTGTQWKAISSVASAMWATSMTSRRWEVRRKPV